MKKDFIELNAGKAEVFALYPGELHFIADRNRVPARFAVDNQGPGLSSIPGCAIIDLPPSEASSEIEAIREGWYAAIRAGAMSASTCPYATHHSPALLTYLRAELGSDTPIPEPRVARKLL